MILVENLRDLPSEVAEISDTATYSQAAPVYDWTTLVTKNVTLSATRIVSIKYDSVAQGVAGSVGYGATRVLLDGVPIHVNPVASGGAAETSETKNIGLVLAAATYAFAFQGSLFQTGGAGGEAIRVRNIYIGSHNLPDKTSLTGDSGATAIDATTESIILTISPTIAATRTTPIGTIRKYTALLYVVCEKQADRNSVMKNTGESNEASKLNWKIFIDGVQKDWTEREDDDAWTSNPTYGEGAHGLYATAFSAGATPAITVRCYNGFGTSQTGRVYAQLILCPWLLGSSSEPVDFTMALGSTLYMVLEPLFANPTKTLQLGKVRGISWGSTNDYYSTSTGADRISYTYTFDYFDPASTILFLTGIGAAISVIAVDVR